MLVSTASTLPKRPWLSWFWPSVVEIRPSKINGQIKVLRFWNRFQFSVKAVTQSGGLVKSLWHQALHQIRSSYDLPASPQILILGLGGGSCLKPLFTFFPQAQVIAVELDPVMVDLGRRYLSLSAYPVRKLVIGDAFIYLSRTQVKYDLILVDLYTGKKIPDRLFNPGFVTGLSHRLNPAGLVCFNFMDRSQSQKLKPLLNSAFPRVRRLSTSVNQVYTAG